MCTRYHLLTGLTILALGSAPSFGQDLERQTDWSGGPGMHGLVEDFGVMFDESTGIAWRSIQGQLALSGELRTEPLRTLITENGADQPWDVAGADLDGDGRTDLVTSDPVYDILEELGAIYWWKLMPDGEWQRRDVSLDFYGANYVDCVDLDQDGDMDIIATRYYNSVRGDGGYAWFENLNGDASRWRQHTVGTFYWGASHIDAADFDGDGDLDLVGASQLTAGVPALEWDVTWFENLDGRGYDWRPHVIDETLDGTVEAHAADFDGDGDVDVLSAWDNGLGMSEFFWFENVNGDGSVFVRHAFEYQFFGPGIADVGDFDGDGDMDFVGVGFRDDLINLYRNVDGQGGVWNIQPIAIGGGLFEIEANDLEGDGDLDLLFTVWGGTFDDSAYILENVSGDAREWELITIEFVNLKDPAICGTDVNNDGRLDAVITSIRSDPDFFDQLAWYDFSSFGSAGELTSSILDTRNSGYRTISWDADMPEGTTLTVEARASNDPENMGGWGTATFPGEALSGIIDPFGRYFQYRLTLTSDSAVTSPVVRSVSINDLHLTPFEPGIAGQMNTMTAYWEVGQTVYFVYSLRPGFISVPGCPGVQLELGSDAKLLGTRRAGIGFDANLEMMIPNGARGREVFFQAVVRNGCVTSNRVLQRFE